MFENYVRNLEDIRNRLKRMRHLQLLKTDDPGKIVILTGETNITGGTLFEILRDSYGIELEMYEISYVTAMTSICDSKAALDKLCTALMQIDKKLHDTKDCGVYIMPVNEQIMTPYETKLKTRKLVEPAEAIGEISAEFIFLYPPGIPAVVPGERISKEILEKIQSYQKRKMNLIGLYEGRIYIVDERV